jgi:hypothetical protein
VHGKLTLTKLHSLDQKSAKSYRTLKTVPRSNLIEVLEDRKLEWSIPEDWPRDQAAVTRRVLSELLPDLKPTLKAFEEGTLMLVRKGQG